MGLFVYAYATPLFYDDRAIDVGYPARLSMFVLSVVGVMLVIQFLKGGS